MQLATNAFIGYLETGPWGVVAKNVGNPKILGSSYTAATNLVTLRANMAGLAVGKVVTLYGIRRSIVRQRNFVVAQTLTPDSFSPTIPLSAFNIPGSSWSFRLTDPQLYSGLDVIQEGITERKVGRPFGQPRGRAAVIR